MAYTYTTLSAAIGSWAERTYTSAQTDEFIMLAEAAINRRLDGYERETSATIALTAGIGALPTDFIRAVSVSYSPYGTLRQVSPDALIKFNPDGVSGIPAEYAISGTSLTTADTLTGSVAIIYMASLAPLSASQTTNWLLTLAPDAYLFMCKSMQRAFEEDWQVASGFEAKANGILDELNQQSNIAQYGHAALTINGPTP